MISIPPEADRELQLGIQKLADLDLSDKARKCVLCELYIQYGQTNKAIDQLEELLNTNGQSGITPEEISNIRASLQQARMEQSSDAQEKLKGLLGQVQTLLSIEACNCNNGYGRWSWNPPTWFCRGC